MLEIQCYNYLPKMQKNMRQNVSSLLTTYLPTSFSTRNMTPTALEGTANRPPGHATGAAGPAAIPPGHLLALSAAPGAGRRASAGGGGQGGAGGGGGGERFQSGRRQVSGGDLRRGRTVKT